MTGERMKTISDTETFAELMSARDELSALQSRIYEFSRRVIAEDTPESRLLASVLRECQLAIVQAEDRLNVTARCYAE
jgi:hypothetical protein